jgi:murein DD-endopeptidase MepM/ murein hydrolase activator NlpD
MRPLARLVALSLLAGCGGSAPPSPAPGDAADAGAPPPTREVVGAPTISGDCGPDAPLCLAWPLAGRAGRDWVVTNYLDLDPGPGLADYTGATGTAAKTYDGHQGVDISLPGFPAMDEGVTIRAAADGVVVSTTDGFFDRNTAWPPNCGDLVNSVFVRHDGGLVVRYLHLRKGSVMVERGQRISTGQALGLVGSSGCSDGPHLHLGIRDSAGRVVDPSTRRMFASAPVYDPPLALMTTDLSATPFDSASAADPPADATAVAAGSTIGVLVVVSSAHLGDRIAARFLRPDGSLLSEAEFAFDKMAYRRAFAYWNRTVGAETGPWSVAVSLDGVEATRLTVPVR